MAGPISFFSSSPLPTRSAAARSASIAVNFLTTLRCTRRREDAVQRWPLVPNAPQIAPSTASSRFASSITMIGFLPPISRWTCLNEGAHASLIARPTDVEPVNETTFTRGSFRSGFPTFEPEPVTTLKTPGGSPASSSAFAKFTTESGVSVAGLMTTVFPQTSAAVDFQAGIAMGKFHGVMNAQTPIGERTDIANLFGSSDGVVWPCSRRPSPPMRKAMSMASWTSPRASLRTLPISRVMSRAYCSLRSRRISPRR